MSILTKPASIAKNTAATFTLSKATLASNPAITDVYFQDTNNWKSVILVYQSSVGDQREILVFDATIASPTASFLVSEKARDIFQIKRIIIKDFDGGSFEIERSSLTTVEFDITLSAGGGGGGALTWTSDISPAAYIATATSIEKLSSSGWDFNVVSDQTLTGDMFIEARVATYPNNMIIGFQNTSANSSSQSVVLGAINYGLYCDPGQGLVFFSKSALSYNMTPVSSLSLNDIIKISISGGATGTINIYKNSTLVYTTPVASVTPFGIPYSEPYRLGVVLNESGSKLDNIVFDNI